MNVPRCYVIIIMDAFSIKEEKKKHICNFFNPRNRTCYILYMRGPEYARKIIVRLHYKKNKLDSSGNYVSRPVKLYLANFKKVYMDMDIVEFIF